jgi:hypothetical protein
MLSESEADMFTEKITNGSRQAIINANTECTEQCGLNWEDCAAAGHVKQVSGTFWTRLYVNNGETATTISAKAKTLGGARKQALKMLEAR